MIDCFTWKTQQREGVRRFETVRKQVPSAEYFVSPLEATPAEATAYHDGRFCGVQGAGKVLLLLLGEEFEGSPVRVCECCGGAVAAARRAQRTSRWAFPFGWFHNVDESMVFDNLEWHVRTLPTPTPSRQPTGVSCLSRSPGAAPPPCDTYAEESFFLSVWERGEPPPPLG